MSVRPQERRQEEPRVPFMKMRGCPNGFRSFVKLASFGRGIEEGAAQKRRRLRKPQARRIGPRRARTLEDYSNSAVGSRKVGILRFLWRPFL